VHIQIESLIAAGIILLVSFPVHEFSHAYVAYRLGDGTAKLFGRLTLNPIVHFDPIGGLLLIASSLTGFGIGWAKPTPVNPSNLRGGRDSEGIVAFAGPASNLVLAAIGAIPIRLLEATHASVPSSVSLVLIYFVIINVALMLFNLIPIPPLDGSKVLFSMMNPRQVWQWRPTLEQYIATFCKLSETIDNMRSVYQNVGETDALIGLYPYAPLHDMRRALQTLDPRKNSSSDVDTRNLVRDAILQSFYALRETFLEELDLEEPDHPLLISGGRRAKKSGSTGSARRAQERQRVRQDRSPPPEPRIDELLAQLNAKENATAKPWRQPTADAVAASAPNGRAV